MLNMASEQRTELNDVHKRKRRIAAMLHALGTASRQKSTRYLIRLRQGSPVIATGYKWNTSTCGGFVRENKTN